MYLVAHYHFVLDPAARLRLHCISDQFKQSCLISFDEVSRLCVRSYSPLLCVGASGTSVMFLTVGHHCAYNNLDCSTGKYAGGQQPR
jgi:hypothetical protein